MKRALTLLLLISLISSCLYSDSEPRMINMKRLLIAYGFDDGIFYGTKDIATAEEFITGALFWPAFAWDEEIVEEEVPQNKVGLFRVCSMWLLKIAEQPENKEKYLAEIDSIKEEAKKNHIFDTTDKRYEFGEIHVTIEEIQEYYKQAIKNKIDSIEIVDLNDEEKKQAQTLLFNYCIQPNEENKISLINYKNKLIQSNKDKADVFLEFINKLSPIIMEMIANKGSN